MRAHVPRWVRLTFVSVLALTGASLTAQSGTAPTGRPDAPSLRWRNIGNANLIGRISPSTRSNPTSRTSSPGSASGGVWKSTNAGTSWTTIFDNYGAASIGDVRINQKNPQIIWVGTGRSAAATRPRGATASTSRTDGGATFINVGLKESYNIGKIVLHPTNREHRLRRGDRQHLCAGRRAQASSRRSTAATNVDEARRTDCLNDPQTGAIDHGDGSRRIRKSST